MLTFPASHRTLLSVSLPLFRLRNFQPRICANRAVSPLTDRLRQPESFGSQDDPVLRNWFRHPFPRFCLPDVRSPSFPSNLPSLLAPTLCFFCGRERNESSLADFFLWMLLPPSSFDSHAGSIYGHSHKASS